MEALLRKVSILSMLHLEECFMWKKGRENVFRKETDSWGNLGTLIDVVHQIHPSHVPCGETPPAGPWW
jgi:hypothetical protein